ncbi:MAG: hypothetical protein INR64_13735, partial [Caulobacteraceae bacterium]|nr:hypothetical protein [Caulobacter sp.]
MIRPALVQDTMDPSPSRSLPRRLDPLGMAAAVFLVCAAAAAAWPAFHAGGLKGGGVLLLLGLAGFCVLGVLALLAPGAASRNPAGPGVEAGAAVVDALAEPAAVLAEDGRVRAANAAWRSLW